MSTIVTLTFCICYFQSIFIVKITIENVNLTTGIQALTTFVIC